VLEARPEPVGVVDGVFGVPLGVTDETLVAVGSVWETGRAATTAAGFLTDVDAVSRSVRGTLGDAGEEGATGTGDESVDTDGATGASTNGAPSTNTDAATEIRTDLAEQDVYAGQPHGEDVYALVLYSRADPDELVAAVANLRDGFDRYDTHVRTAVYSTDDGVTAVTGDTTDAGEDTGVPDTDGDDAGPAAEDDVAAVVSLWETAEAADTDADVLTDLPAVVGRPADRDGFTTLGMFYTVKPDYRAEFVETFEDVGGHLVGMDGHRETALLVNRENADDMFVTSRWDEQESATTFFRSKEFRETVDWGRDVLADEPRHVFFA
jgi:chlorite dismutase